MSGRGRGRGRSSRGRGKPRMHKERHVSTMEEVMARNADVGRRRNYDDEEKSGSGSESGSGSGSESISEKPDEKNIEKNEEESAKNGKKSHKREDNECSGGADSSSDGSEEERERRRRPFQHFAKSGDESESEEDIVVGGMRLPGRNQNRNPHPVERTGVTELTRRQKEELEAERKRKHMERLRAEGKIPIPARLVEVRKRREEAMKAATEGKP